METNRHDLENFFRSSKIWSDIENELETWLEEIHRQLENNGGELSGRILDRLGGNAEAIRNVIDIETSIMANYVRLPNEGENDAR